MEIKLGTTVATAFKFLKVEYDLTVDLNRESLSKVGSFPIVRVVNSNKKLVEKVFFVIGGDTLVSELIQFFHKQAGLSIKLRNKDGIKLSDQITLKEVGSIPPLPLSSASIENCIEVGRRVASSGSYSDIDWVFRIFKKAAYKANSSEDNWLIIEALLSMAEQNNQFSSKQNLDIIGSCLKEKQDYEKIYRMLSKSNNTNAILLAKEIKEKIERID